MTWLTKVLQIYYQKKVNKKLTKVLQIYYKKKVNKKWGNNSIKINKTNN